MQQRFDDKHDEILYLLPNELKTNPLCNVRLFSSQMCEDDDEDFERFAHGLEEDGQTHEVVITPNHEIISGHRRVKAFILNNQRRSKNCKSLLRIRCRVDRNPGDLRRKAICANTQCKTLSPMDALYLIHETQKEHPNWSIDETAEYMRVHRATIAKILKLGGACAQLQVQIHKGTISCNTALKIIARTSDPAVQSVIIDQAKTVQMEINTEKIVTQADKNNISRKKATRHLLDMKHTLKIEAPAVNQVIRELHPPNGKVNLSPKPFPHAKRERAELLQGINSLLPYTDHASPKHFLLYFVNVFAGGTGSLEELRKLWQAAIGAH